MLELLCTDIWHFSHDAHVLTRARFQDECYLCRRAALEYSVSKSTLHDRLTGKVLPGAVGGAPRYYLDNEEEEELVKWIIGCAEVGYAVRAIRSRIYCGSKISSLAIVIRRSLLCKVWC